MGFYRAAHGWGEWWQKGNPLPKICWTYPTMLKLGTVNTLANEDQKRYGSRNTRLKFCWNQQFFTGNQQILVYQKIQIYIPFRCIISNSSNFSWVFKDCFNKRGQNFDDVSKNGYLRPSENKDFLEKRIWHHNFCRWLYQKKFITWLKYNVNVFMWPKFGNSSISVREVMITSIW